MCLQKMRAFSYDLRVNMKEIIGSKFDPKDYSVAIVDFWADWCMPCKMLLPVITKLSQEMPSVTFLKANVEENTELAKQHGISSIPALVIFKNGQVVEKMVGVQKESKIQEALQRASL